MHWTAATRQLSITPKGQCCGSRLAFDCKCGRQHGVSVLKDALLGHAEALDPDLLLLQLQVFLQQLCACMIAPIFTMLCGHRRS